MGMCTLWASKRSKTSVFSSGSVPVPNQFKLVLKILNYQKPQTKKRFGSTKSWNHNQNRWFGFGWNRFSMGTKPDCGSTSNKFTPQTMLLSEARELKGRSKTRMCLASIRLWSGRIAPCASFSCIDMHSRDACRISRYFNQCAVCLQTVCIVTSREMTS